VSIQDLDLVEGSEVVEQVYREKTIVKMLLPVKSWGIECAVLNKVVAVNEVEESERRSGNSD